jgi:hypothetical protein
MTEKIRILKEEVDKILETMDKNLFDVIAKKIDCGCDLETLKHLIERRNWDDKTKKLNFEYILHLVCKSFMPERIQSIKYILADKVANINIMDSKIFKINDLLFDSLSYSNTDVMRYFLDDLQIPIDIKKIRNENGQTLLLKIFPSNCFGEFEKVDMKDIRYLVEEKGVNVLDRDNNGNGIEYYFAKYIEEDFLEFCHSNDDIDIMKYLIEKGVIFNKESLINLLSLVYEKKQHCVTNIFNDKDFDIDNNMIMWELYWSSFEKYLEEEFKENYYKVLREEYKKKLEEDYLNIKKGDLL